MSLPSDLSTPREMSPPPLLTCHRPWMSLPLTCYSPPPRCTAAAKYLAFVAKSLVWFCATVSFRRNCSFWQYSTPLALLMGKLTLSPAVWLPKYDCTLWTGQAIDIEQTNTIQQGASLQDIFCWTMCRIIPSRMAGRWGKIARRQCRMVWWNSFDLFYWFQEWGTQSTCIVKLGSWGG